MSLVAGQKDVQGDDDAKADEASFNDPKGYCCLLAPCLHRPSPIILTNMYEYNIIMNRFGI
jgi:hypothetical protein